MKIITLLRIHLITWVLIALCVLTPYILVRIYLPTVPYALYYYLTVLAAIKYIIYQDQAYRNRLRPKLQSYLYKELKKQPSKQEIITRTESMIMTRDVSLVIFAIGGIMVNIIL